MFYFCNGVGLDAFRLGLPSFLCSDKKYTAKNAENSSRNSDCEIELMCYFRFSKRKTVI